MFQYFIQPFILFLLNLAYSMMKNKSNSKVYIIETSFLKHVLNIKELMKIKIHIIDCFLRSSIV